MKFQQLKLWTAIGLSLLLTLGCLTGCSSSLKETDALNIYNLVDSSSTGISGFYEVVFYLFQGQYPDIAFNYRVSDLDDTALTYGDGITAEMGEVLQEYYDNVSVSIMKGDCEDVIYVDTYYQWFSDVTPPDYNKMIRAGAFMDLKPILTELSPDLDLSAFDSLLIDGKLYAVPIYRQPYYIFSAENMLEKWGFDYDSEDNILTFLRKCAVWKEEHASDMEAPEVFTKQAWDYIYYNLFNIMGIEVVDFEDGAANFNIPELLEAIELLKSLRSDFEEPLMNDLASVENQTLIYDRVLFGRSAGTYDGAMMAAIGYNYINDPSVLVPLLQLDGKTATSCATFLMIPENAENKLNAAKYVALVLESVVSHQKMEGKIPSKPRNANPMFAWDVGEEAFENSLTKTRPILVSAESVPDTVRSMYKNQGDIRMPTYWYHSLKYLFDDYMAGEISIDTLASDVQSRLEIYVTE